MMWHESWLSLVLTPLSSLTAWAASRLTRGCGEQAFGEVKHFKMMIAMQWLWLTFVVRILSIFLAHIVYFIHSGWEGSDNNRHGDEHPSSVQQALWGRNLSLAYSPFKSCDHAIKCQYKLRLPKCPPDFSDCACFCAQLKHVNIAEQCTACSRSSKYKDCDMLSASWGQKMGSLDICLVTLGETVIDARP